MKYGRMYAVLCGACSDAIDALDVGHIEEAWRILQDALNETEEIFIEEVDRISEE